MSYSPARSRARRRRSPATTSMSTTGRSARSRSDSFEAPRKGDRMKMPVNTFKQAMLDKQRKIGLWVSLAGSVSAEAVATTGFDWLLIDGEHAPNDVRSLLGQLQAVASYPAHAIVRPVTGDVALIKQLLDIGVQTLLIPMVETAE